MRNAPRQWFVPVVVIGALLLGAGVLSAALIARHNGQSHKTALAASSPAGSPVLASPISSIAVSPTPTAPAQTPTPTPRPSPSPSPSPQQPAAASPSPVPVVPHIPPLTTRGIFRYTSTDFAAMHAGGFNASTDGGVQDNAAAQAAAGITGMVWVDAYSNTACTQTMADAAIAALVQANVSAGLTGYRYAMC